MVYLGIYQLQCMYQSKISLMKSGRSCVCHMSALFFLCEIGIAKLILVEYVESGIQVTCNLK